MQLAPRDSSGGLEPSTETPAINALMQERRCGCCMFSPLTHSKGFVDTCRLAILSQGDWIPLCFRVNRRAVAVYDVLPEVQTLGL